MPVPIRIIDFTDPTDTARHTRMVALVEQMLDHGRPRRPPPPRGRSRLPSAQPAGGANPVGRPFSSGRSRRSEVPFADGLVYELYGLTEEEIAIVEGRQDGNRQV